MLSINHSIFFIAFSTVLYVFLSLYILSAWKLLKTLSKPIPILFISMRINLKLFAIRIDHKPSANQSSMILTNKQCPRKFTVCFYICVRMYVHIVIKKANRIRVHIRTRQMRVDTIISFDGMSCEIVCILFVPLTLFLRTIGSWLCVCACIYYTYGKIMRTGYTVVLLMLNCEEKNCP